jgi:hypothetical protein
MEKPLTSLRVFRDLHCISLALLLLLTAPALLGRFCGHGWGLAAGAATIVVSLCLGRMKMARSTRIIWLLLLLFVVSTTLYEFARLREIP